MLTRLDGTVTASYCDALFIGIEIDKSGHCSVNYRFGSNAVTILTTAYDLEDARRIRDWVASDQSAFRYFLGE